MQVKPFLQLWILGGTNLFADPNFDGDPIVILDSDDDTTKTGKEKDTAGSHNNDDEVREPGATYKPTIVIEAGKLLLRILDKKVQYLNEQGGGIGFRRY